MRFRAGRCRFPGGNLCVIDPLELDPATAAANKRERHIRFHVVELPAMRVLAFGLMAAAGYLHNAIVRTLPIQPRLDAGAFALVVAAYCLGTWILLKRYYRPESRVSLGTVAGRRPGPRRHRAAARAIGRAQSRAPAGRGRQPRQGRVSREHESRDPHAAQRHDRDDGPAARHQADDGAARLRPHGPHVGRAPALGHQPHPGLLEDRGRASRDRTRGVQRRYSTEVRS
jgi:hypothetical protein